MYLLLVLSLICLVVIFAYLALKNYLWPEEDTELPSINKQTLSSDNTKLQLQTLMSSQRVSSPGVTEHSHPKKAVKEEDSLIRLSKIESRIAAGLEVLDELTDDGPDFTLIVASAKVAKLKVFGRKFLKVVQGRAAKATELKNSGNLSEKEIDKFIVRSFTVEMSVMNDLLDRDNYVTAVSWKDLTSMIETFESDIQEVSKLIKSNKQGLSSSL